MGLAQVDYMQELLGNIFNRKRAPFPTRTVQGTGAILAAGMLLLTLPSTTKPDFSGHSRYHSHTEIRRAINWYAKQYRLDPALLRAVIKAESDFNPSAVSRKGAVGLMQLMPRTVQSLHVGDPFDPVQNIRAGARQLRTLLNRYHGNVPLALAAYNAGADRVKGRQIPRIRETRVYVRKVLRYYQVFRTASSHDMGKRTEIKPSRTHSRMKKGV